MIEDSQNGFEFFVENDDVGTRVDIVVARLLQATRSQVTDAARSGDIRINGKVAKPARYSRSTITCRPSFPTKSCSRLNLKTSRLISCTKTTSSIVVNKIAGMVTHPAHGSPDGTLVNALLAHTGKLPGDPVRAGLIHRLDRDTSGLLLIAKTPETLTTLGRAMQKRYIKREYLGLVVGSPDDEAGTLEGSIGRDPQNRMKYSVRADGNTPSRISR